MHAIPPLNFSGAPAAPASLSPASPFESKGLASSAPSVFEQFVSQTNQAQLTSDQAIQDFIAQKPGSNVQQVVMSVARAEMSFQLFMEIRNKLIDSYNELMRMQF